MGIRKFLDNIAPHFHKGGKLERLYPAFEMLDTFLYNPGDTTAGKTHARDGIDVKRIMTTVIIALIPCIYMALYNTGLQANLIIQKMTLTDLSGWRHSVIALLGVGYDPASVVANIVHGALYFLPVYFVTIAVGGAWETLFSVVRRHEVNEGFLVTSMLFPLILPPTIPLWQVAVGISFGIVFGKEIFGGTGRNIMNPALVGRAFLFFAYPAAISSDRVWVAVDGVSQSTPLASAAANGMTDFPFSFMDAFIGVIPGSMGETSTLGILFGAAVLIITGVGSWRIMVGSVAGLVSISGLLYLMGSDTNPMFQMSPAWHLVAGGFAFGTVFMATDPVSAAMTNTGRWIYGFVIGTFVALVRIVNPAYPEGVMLAILFANVLAPTIDYFVVKANMKRRARLYVG